MADARRLTLLGLATFAVIAVAPVLVAVLLVVADTREAELARPVRSSDRHVSVRHVAALRTFEAAIVRRDRVQGALPSAQDLLARLPQCARDWDGRGGRVAQLRHWLSGAPDTAISPAVRIAAQLEAVDAALGRFSSSAHRRVVDPVGIDGVRWLDAVVVALATPLASSDYPEHRFRVQCADIATAVFALARNDGRMLEALAWRGTEVERVVARWRPEQYVAISPRHVARTNPWTGIPGCIYLARNAHESPAFYLAGMRALDDRLCTRPEMLGAPIAPAGASRVAGEPAPDMALDDRRWRWPASIARMLQPLETLHRPSGALYRAYTAGGDDAGRAGYSFGPNRLRIDGNAVDVGFSIDLTIDPEVQALAQQTAACYTGRADICRALGMQRKEDAGRDIGAAMLEQAMVRMAAIAIIDVPTGRIEALAGAMSPCTREEYDGVGRSPRCDRRLPYPIRYRPDALLNPAVFHDAMPASTIKPIMAAAFLSDPLVGARWLAAEQAEMRRAPGALPSAQSLRAQLMRSDSARFLDRMFCADRNFIGCDRPWAVQAMAGTFGWNAACTTPQHDCGRHDLLFGRSIDADESPLALEVAYGRVLTEPLGGKLGAPFRMHARTAYDPAKAQQCAAGGDGRRGSKDDWEKCRGRIVVDLAAEGWGQGHARATALGGAGMMAALAAAANGETATPRPHLVEAVRGTGPMPGSLIKAAVARAAPPPSGAAALSPEAAEVIVSGLSFGHRAGTSRLACEQVFDAKACQQIDWIAGKTGTPTFPNDDRTLDDLGRLCARRDNLTRDERVACGPLKPYKWYVAAYRTDRSDPRWTKAIGVLTERNWIARTGRIHGAGDHGPNPAAEIALQIAARHAGALAWGAP